MRGTACLLALLALLALASTRPVRSQELAGWLVLEGNPGYLTNAYLDPGFATWTPDVETGFGALGATGLLEWTGRRTSVSAAASGRWMGFADSTSAWQSYLVRGGLERRLGGAIAVAADGSFSEIRRPTARQTFWGQATLRWTASSRLRLAVGPGIAERRFDAQSEGEVAGGAIPPLPGTGSPGASGDGPRTGATSYLLSASLEAWPGARWQVGSDLYAAHTRAADLGIDYRGGGGSLRLTRWLGGGLSITAGAGLEGFGYRAATEAAGDPTVEVPEDDLIWRAELGVGWPLGRRAALHARVAGLGREGSSDGEGADVYASAGLRLTLGGTLSASRREGVRWTPTPEGVRVRVSYEGPGTLFLVGDFNGWADPGEPLRPEGGGLHGTTLRLDPGSYRYRIRLVVGEEESWLELPESTPTVEDGFGGTNGLVVVGEHPGTTGRER